MQLYCVCKGKLIFETLFQMNWFIGLSLVYLGRDGGIEKLIDTYFQRIQVA